MQIADDNEAKKSVFPGMLVQLSPDIGNRMFACCIMTVTDVKDWGVKGFVQLVGENRCQGGQAYYRAKWEEFEPVGFSEWSTNYPPRSENFCVMQYGNKDKGFKRSF